MSSDEGCGKASQCPERSKAHSLKTHGKLQSVLRCGLALIPSKSPYNPNVVVESAQFLGQRYRYRLIQNGNCLLVSLPLDAGHTLPTMITHAHLLNPLDQPENSSQIKLIMASHPSIVLVYENKTHKELAKRQIENLKFQFEDKILSNSKYKISEIMKLAPEPCTLLVLVLFISVTTETRFSDFSVRKGLCLSTTSSRRV